MRYKWVWFHGANREVSVLRWGPSSSQQVFQRARLCQTSRSRVHSLPETGAVWLSSCYWLLFLWRAGFCQVNFFSFPLLPAVRTQTVQNCTRKHSRPSRCLQHQIVICHPVASVQYLISKWRPVQRPDAKRINETKMQNECWICNRNTEKKITLKFWQDTLKVLGDFSLFLEELKLYRYWFCTYFIMSVGQFEAVLRRLVSEDRAATTSLAQKIGDTLDTLPYVVSKMVVYIICSSFVEEHLELKTQTPNLSAILVDVVKDRYNICSAQQF